MFNARNLIDVGPITINLYGITFVFAALVLLFLLKVYCRKNHYDEEQAIPGTLALMGGMFIGARALYVLIYDSQLLTQPLEALAFWHGGMSFHGGLAGMLLGGYLFTRVHHWSPARLADTLIIPALIFMALGRVANFFNHEIYGVVTSLPWCVEFTTIFGCRHPIQLYDGVALIFVAIGAAWFKNRASRPGKIFIGSLLAYTSIRYFIDFFRETSMLYWGVRAEHILGTLTIIVLIGIMLKESFVQKLLAKDRDDGVRSPQSKEYPQ